MDIVETENKIAIIVAIENYAKPPSGRGLPQVQYARNDAELMKSVFIDHMGVEPDNVFEYFDEQATKTTLENDIPYYINSLSASDCLYIYYVGHGCFSEGANRITAYDSNSINIYGTTLSIDELIFKPLQNSECTRTMLFLDACSESIKELSSSRGIIDALNDEEFLKFIELNQYSAVFCSSSPGESSYPSDILKNGIWTWHLANALKGLEQYAIDRDNIITSTSLQNYLKYSVKKFITRNKEFAATQTPFAILKAESSFKIVEIPIVEDDDSQQFVVDYDKALLVSLENFQIADAPWFDKRKRHFVPDYISNSTSSFIIKNESPNVREEIQEIYLNTKNTLSLKKRYIDKSVSEASGSIDTEYFRYDMNVDQDSEDPSRYFYYRTLQLRKPLNQYPDDFDTIFPNSFNEISLPYRGELGFDDLVDKLEDYEDEVGGYLIENEDENLIQYTMTNGLKLKIDFNGNRISFHPESSPGCISLIESFSEQLLEIGSIKKYLLPDNT